MNHELSQREYFFQIVFFLLSICGFCTVAAAIWEGFIGYYFQYFLPWDKIVVPQHIQGATIIGLLVFFSYAIVLNTVVPISLYVSVEVRERLDFKWG